MSGFEPILIGSAIGAATNRRNPLSGALLGGVLGGVGGAAYNAVNPATTAIGTTAGGMPVAVTGVTPGAALPSAALPASKVALPSTFVGDVGVMGTPTMSMQLPNTLPMANPTMPGIISTNASTGLIPSMTAPVTMMDRLGAMGSFAKENPYAVGIGLQSANSLLATQPPPAMAPPPGLMRGQQFQVEQPQYAMFQPKPISLI